jgi:hypothetical protein
LVKYLQIKIKPRQGNGTELFAVVNSIPLGTDGLLPPDWDIEKPEVRKQLEAVLLKGGLPKLIQLKKAAEDADPDWVITRYKHSDDATGIWVQL